jgi:succinate dehydrogenase / fumarate reductase, membrane anchor subunit
MANHRLRTPLGNALGLGSAKEGVQHWWLQRVTAVALVPLTLWFVAALVAHLGADHASAVVWLGAPLTAIAMILLVVATFVHTALGLQVVIEDYVHHEATKIASLVLVRLACWALGAAALFAVLRVAFGS